MVRQLRTIGVERGSLLLVHTAFSQVAPVVGGPQGLIDALLASLGDDGTLVMPSMSDDDEHPFDAGSTPCLAMGVVADTFWRMSGVQRSDSPHAFAAVGPLAVEITAAHPVHTPHGLDSPVGRVFERDGSVLLIGVGHDANTTIHLAENMAGVRYRCPKYAMVRDAGRVVRYDYAEVDHCCQNFALMDQWLESQGEQRRGMVGHATARLMRARSAVEIARAHLRRDETAFLHARTSCADCDAAWQSLDLAGHREEL